MRHVLLTKVLTVLTLITYSQTPITQIEGFLEVYPSGDPSSIFIGKSTGQASTSFVGSNTFVGERAGYLNTTGYSNSFYGRLAGYSNTIGYANSFYGRSAGYSNTTGYSNSFFGRASGFSNSTGSSNSFFGQNAGVAITTQSQMIVIGANAGPVTASSSDSMQLFIDVEQSDDPLIYGEFDNDLFRINGTLETTGRITGSTELAFTMNGSSDNGLILSDRDGPSSDLVLDSNHDIVLELDSNGDENGQFRVLNSGDTTIFRLFESGSLNIAGTLFQGSDRRRKDHIRKVNSSEILEKLTEVSLYTWHYKDDGVPHIGPMAQDFYAAFGLGQGETTIATVDADGVALAGIQALAEENAKLKLENKKFETRVALLEEEKRKQVEYNQELEKRIAKIEGLLLSHK